jgi:hypothetical protein
MSGQVPSHLITLYYVFYWILMFSGAFIVKISREQFESGLPLPMVNQTDILVLQD